jgi:DNA invertase Pin-like site-specific DNA recombinase
VSSTQVLDVNSLAESRAFALAVRHGYTLDQSVRADEGKSAYHLRHLAKGGNLGKFVALVESGDIPPGSALVIESLDRLSRADPDTSLQLARRILVAGVDIVTLLPEDCYTRAGLSDSIQWVKLVMYFQRAHEESRMKAHRIAENWTQRRAAMARGEVLGGSAPFWLDRTAEGWRVNSRAKWVREIFERAAEGYGTLRLSKLCAEKGWSFGVRRKDVGKWPTKTTIWRLLQSRTVLGELHPRHHPEPIPGYYPAIIPADLWHRVQGIIKDPDRRKKGGRPGEGITCLFSGLIYDVRDGAKVYVQSKLSSHYLVSYAALSGRATWVGFRYPAFESAMLRACREIDPATLAPADQGAEEVRACEGRYQEACHKEERAQSRLDRAADADEEEALAGALVRAVRARKQAEKELETARSKVCAQPARQMERLKVLLSKNPADRQRIKGLIATLVRRIEVLIQRRGARERRCWATVYFYSGAVRQMMISGSGAALTWSCGDKEAGMVVEGEEGWTAY